MKILREKIQSNLVIVGGIAVLFLGIVLMSTGKASLEAKNQSTGETLSRAPLVEIHTVGAPTRSYSIIATGRLRPQNRLQIVGEVSGKVTYINPLFKVGGRLQKDDILFRVNPVTYEADVAQAEAALSNAKAQQVKASLDHDRTTDLHKNGNISKAAIDASEAALLSAAAGVKQAKAQHAFALEMLARTVIRSPFEALVVSEAVTIDSFVTPGQVLAELMDTDSGEVAISLHRDEVLAVARTYRQTGEKPIPVTARPGSGAVGSLPIEGRITRIAPVIDTASRTAVIIAEFEKVFAQSNAGRVFGDDFMTVEIEATSADPLWTLPYSAVRRGAYVWTVLKNGKIRKHPVTVMASTNGSAIVASPTPLDGATVMLTLLPEEIEGRTVRANPEQK